MKDKGKILYNHFLEDKNTYNLNVGYWRRKLQKAIAQKIEIADQPIQNRNESGKSFYDGNPIFSFYNKEMFRWQSISCRKSKSKWQSNWFADKR